MTTPPAIPPAIATISSATPPASGAATSTVGVVPRKRTEVALALIFDAAGRLLICKRKPDAVLAGFWEFPGGKCHAGEAPADCARRETLEETNLVVAILKPLAPIEHHYPHADVRLHPFLCRHVSGELQLLAVADARWIRVEDLGQFEFPQANASLIEQAGRGFAAMQGA